MESLIGRIVLQKGGALYFKYRNKFFFDYGWDIIFNKISLQLIGNLLFGLIKKIKENLLSMAIYFE